MSVTVKKPSKKVATKPKKAMTKKQQAALAKGQRRMKAAAKAYNAGEFPTMAKALKNVS